eukprot:31197-Pelagococcus_subviridis.AAC.2
MDQHRVEPRPDAHALFILRSRPLHVPFHAEHLMQPRVAYVPEAVQRDARLALLKKHRLDLNLPRPRPAEGVLAEVVHEVARGEDVDRAEVLAPGGVVVVACGRGREEGGAGRVGLGGGATSESRRLVGTRPGRPDSSAGGRDARAP